MTTQALATDSSMRSDRVSVQRVPLSDRQRNLIETAWASLDVKEALDLDVALTNIWSHTGYERELSEYAVEHFASAGLESFYQSIDPSQGNAIRAFLAATTAVRPCCSLHLATVTSPESKKMTACNGVIRCVGTTVSRPSSKTRRSLD